MRQTFAPALLLLLSACGGGAEKTEAPAEPAGQAEAGTPPAATGPSLALAPAAFAQCATCHAIKPGVNAVGPSLFAVYGRKAATGPAYAYSEAMKASGLTWDDATLDSYLTAPMKHVPGTKMTYAGMADAAKRKEVIEFLKTLK
ncbi:c-type cytochrome [Novosphingobium aquae]|uniref:C-type cytochrome n=1 Tax=Novosphingobium aquae TaxID=3133435 RepID=A0ABU8SBV8_9SPHN